MAEYLITKTSSQPPLEYLRYKWRTMYHCPPSVLAEQKGPYLLEMLQDLACERMEAKASKLKQTLG